LRNRFSQNLGTSLKFVHRHELAGPVRLANVAGADYDGFAAEFHHLRRFCPECHCARFVSGRLLQKPDQR
jgi:hypothetical protein